MKRSLPSRSIGLCSRRGAAAAAACLLLYAGAACGPAESGPPPECTEADLPLVPFPEALGDSLEQEGVLAVEVIEDRTAGRTSSRVKVLFHDLGTYVGRQAPFEFVSENCWIVTGQPVIESPPTPLNASAVVVSGLTPGPVDLGSVSGTYQQGFSEAVLGESAVGLSAQPGPDPAFPAVEASGPAAAPLEALRADRPLVNGDIEMTWTPGEGDYVHLEVVTDDPSDPGNPTRRNRLVCRVVDDGCHAIPVAGIDWLSTHQSQASVTVERHRITYQALAPGVLATVDTIQSTVDTLDLVEGALGSAE